MPQPASAAYVKRIQRLIQELAPKISTEYGHSVDHVIGLIGFPMDESGVKIEYAKATVIYSACCLLNQGLSFKNDAFKDVRALTRQQSKAARIVLSQELGISRRVGSYLWDLAYEVRILPKVPITHQYATNPTYLFLMSKD